MNRYREYLEGSFVVAGMVVRELFLAAGSAWHAGHESRAQVQAVVESGRRDRQRIPSNVPVTWRQAGSGIVSSGRVRDVSETGLYVETELPAPEDSHVFMCLYRDRAMSAEGVVKRVTGQGMGIRLLGAG